MTYTQLALTGLAVAATVDLVGLRTFLIVRKAFWAAYAILLVFQLIVNGVLTGVGVVRYNAADIIGLRIVHAPVEDIGFGFALILITLSFWVFLGRRATGRSAARPSLSSLTAAFRLQVARLQASRLQTVDFWPLDFWPFDFRSLDYRSLDFRPATSDRRLQTLDFRPSTSGPSTSASQIKPNRGRTAHRRRCWTTGPRRARAANAATASADR